MEVFRNVNDISVQEECAVSVGTFDGIHVGHLEVLKTMFEEAKKQGIKTLVYTFQNHPASLFKQGFVMPMIMNEAEKYAILEELGADYVCNVPFDKYQHEVSADEFVRDVLVNKCHAKSVSVGYDFKFGFGATSGTEELKSYGEELGFVVRITPPVSVDGERVSSTNIRRLLLDGELKKASKLLGREHFIIGEITSGKQLGRKIGFPTINIDRQKVEALRKGVYFTQCIIDGEHFNGITNIGVNPTVSDTALVKAETHILNTSFTESLYGHKAKVVFLKWHRDEVKFASQEELRETVLGDIEQAKAFFAK